MVFSFLYLYVLQADLLRQLQYTLSAGQTSYEPLVGALLITLVLALPGIVLQRILPLPIRMKSVAWIPSGLLLMTLTFWHVGLDDEISLGRLLWLILPAAVFLVALFLGKSWPDAKSEQAPFVAFLSPNLLILALLCIVVGWAGNTRTPFLYELKMARLLDEGRYEEALKVGERSLQTSRRLTSMRCYALSQTNQMGERLFHYRLCGGSQEMLPLLSDTMRFVNMPRRIYNYLKYKPAENSQTPVVRFLEMASQRDTTDYHVLREYLLSAYLLDRRLDLFAERLSEDSLSSSLPTHYRQALVLLAAQDSTYHYPLNDSIPAAYESFLETMNDESDSLLPEDRCLRDFADTYWYYYFFGEKLAAPN